MTEARIGNSLKLSEKKMHVDNVYPFISGPWGMDSSRTFYLHTGPGVSTRFTQGEELDAATQEGVATVYRLNAEYKKPDSTEIFSRIY